MQGTPPDLNGLDYKRNYAAFQMIQDGGPMSIFRLFAERRYRREQQAKVLECEGTYFIADSGMFWIYGKYIRTVDRHRIYAHCFSEICLDGEHGTFPIKKILHPLTEEEFNAARRNGWKNLPAGG